MFGFLRKKDDLRALNQRMGRLLNSVQYSDLNNEKQRSESRTRVAQPCIVFRFDESSSPKSYTTGISSDISLHGMSLFVPDAIEHGDYILILAMANLSYVTSRMQALRKDEIRILLRGIRVHKGVA